MSEPIIITVDGPGGAGKGELTKHLAKHYGFELLDSGALYRVLAYAARKAGLALFDEDSVAQEAEFMDIKFVPLLDGVHVILGDEDISDKIRTEEAGANASKIAAFPKVREALLDRQRDFCKMPGLVADGRDMGTVVFPEAQVKIFLDASCEIRAERRVRQLELAGKTADYEQILQEIKDRDFRDRNREIAPLVPAEDAILIDSGNMSVEEMVQHAISLIDEKLKSNKE